MLQLLRFLLIILRFDECLLHLGRLTEVAPEMIVVLEYFPAVYRVSQVVLIIIFLKKLLNLEGSENGVVEVVGLVGSLRAATDEAVIMNSQVPYLVLD